MTHHPTINWQTALLEYGGIEGGHLKCAKGLYTLDGAAVSVGDNGLKIVVVMDTACHGSVRWENQAIVERHIQRYEDAAPSGDIGEGFSPYLQFLAVGADETHVGRLMTFTSSAWSGRRAFGA